MASVTRPETGSSSSTSGQSDSRLPSSAGNPLRALIASSQALRPSASPAGTQTMKSSASIPPMSAGAMTVPSPESARAKAQLPGMGAAALKTVEAKERAPSPPMRIDERSLMSARAQPSMGAFHSPSPSP